MQLFATELVQKQFNVRCSVEFKCGITLNMANFWCYLIVFHQPEFRNLRRIQIERFRKQRAESTDSKSTLSFLFELLSIKVSPYFVTVSLQTRQGRIDGFHVDFFSGPSQLGAFQSCIAQQNKITERFPGLLQIFFNMS